MSEKVTPEFSLRISFGAHLFFSFANFLFFIFIKTSCLEIELTILNIDYTERVQC